MTGTVETDLILSRGYTGSNTLHTSFHGRADESVFSEKRWRENIPQSLAVSSSGTAWGNSIIRALSSESGCITPFRLFGTGTAQFIFPFDSMERSESAKKAMALLDQWMNDDSGYDEETWPQLKKSLDRERLSHRRFFDAESDPS